mgnify:CR=1 FL=1
MNGGGFLYTVIIGGLAGLVAKFLMGGREFSGFFITIALGIAGSVVATWARSSYWRSIACSRDAG